MKLIKTQKCSDISLYLGASNLAPKSSAVSNLAPKSSAVSSTCGKNPCRKPGIQKQTVSLGNLGKIKQDSNTSASKQGLNCGEENEKYHTG